MLLLTGVVAGACNNPASSYSLTVINGGMGQDTAFAEMYKCNCGPVVNWLCVWLQIQYKSGNNYYFIPDGYYKTDYQINAAHAGVMIKHTNINWAEAHFWAQCHEGEELHEIMNRNVETEGYSY